MTCHQGLGDHLACAGIYREYASRYEILVLPVVKKYLPELEKITGDLPQIHLTTYSNRFWESQMLEHRKQFEENTLFDILNLGYYGKGFFSDPGMRVDANFYSQAKLDLQVRWTGFSYTRDLEKENNLFEQFVPTNKPYIFLHEDETRNYLVDRSRLPNGVQIVSPDPHLKNYSLFDYRKIIENAEQIHCIESSFSAYTDNLLLDNLKFAHRYARPEARDDFKHEFTYKADWEILL
jgi:hypothetical protein